MNQKQMNILVAVDGSDNSNRAIVQAKKYSEILNGKVTLLTVVKPLAAEQYLYMNTPVPYENEWVNTVGKSVLEKALKVLGQPQDEVVTKVRKGNPAEEILEEAEEVEYDLIIMGSRGLGVFSRSLLGSVSNQVLNHANTDVLIIK